VAPLDMLAELREDNLLLATHMREAHGLCEEHGDVTSTSFLVNWIDEAESRVWYLCEVTRPGEASLTR
jgi:starvation-inducible DNA-binding protein